MLKLFHPHTVTLIWLTGTVAACQALGGGVNSSGEARVNPVDQAGLEETEAIEIMALDDSQSDFDYETVTTLREPEVIAAFIEALDAQFPLQPPSRCIPRFRLLFSLPDGRTEEFSYFCEEDRAFLRGEQDFWSSQEIVPPREFQELMMDLLDPSRNSLKINTLVGTRRIRTVQTNY